MTRGGVQELGNRPGRLTVEFRGAGWLDQGGQERPRTLGLYSVRMERGEAGMFTRGPVADGRV